MRNLTGDGKLAVVNRLHWLGIVLVLFSLLAGCTPESRQESINLNEIQIVYGREGGIAGIKQEWVIHADGLIEGPGDQILLAPPEDVMKILEAGATADIETLAAAATTPDSCCDQFTYTLSFVAGEESWNLVQTDDSDQPLEVSSLFSMVEELIAEAEPAS